MSDAPAGPPPDAGADPRGRSPLARLAALLVTLLACALAAADAWRLAPCADEPARLATATWMLRTGDCCVGLFDTPSSVPAGLAFHAGRGAGFALPPIAPSAAKLGVALFEARAGDWPRRLARARLVNLPLLALMAACAFALGRRVAGDAGGLVATSLAVLDPSTLGQAALVSADFQMVALWPALALALVRIVERPTWARGAVAGVALGAFLVTKHSALLPAGVAGLVALLTPWPDRREAVRTRLVPLALAGVAGLVLLAAAYLAPLHRFFHPLGMDFTRRMMARGYDAWLLGEHGQGWLEYFAVVLLVKVPLVALVAAAGGCAALVLRRAPAGATVRIVAWPALALFVVASLSRHDIGVRHVLVVIASLAVLAAGALHLVPARWRVAVALAITALSALPRERLAFGNAVASALGGVGRVLSDSNVDWGQDAWRLADWRGDHQEGALVAVLFSPIPPRLFGMDVHELAGASGRPPSPGPLPADARWFAISLMELHGTGLPDKDRHAFFRERPAAFELGAIRVFDLAADPEALAEVRRLAGEGAGAD